MLIRASIVGVRRSILCLKYYLVGLSNRLTVTTSKISELFMFSFDAFLKVLRITSAFTFHILFTNRVKNMEHTYSDLMHFEVSLRSNHWFKLISGIVRFTCMLKVDAFGSFLRSNHSISLDHYRIKALPVQIWCVLLRFWDRLPGYSLLSPLVVSVVWSEYPYPGRSSSPAPVSTHKTKNYNHY